jgi:uncharacterized protein (TIGR03083 family)
VSDVTDAYFRTRARMCEVVLDASPDDLARAVPACPAWSTKDLVAHVVSMPAALGAARRPEGDIGTWLQELVVERHGQDAAALVAEWRSMHEPLVELLDGGAGLLFGDLAVHEHDLRGAVGRPDHSALEVDVFMPRTVAAFANPLRDAGLGAIEVRHEGRSWRSHDAEPGWVLLVGPWEAARALNSRRTTAELLALPAEGDARPYVPVLEAHLPLPTGSLGERDGA